MSSPRSMVSRDEPPTGAGLRKYITINSEYLVEAGVCRAVRSRAEAAANPIFQAVARPVVAFVRWQRGGSPQVIRGGDASVGDSLLLGGAGEETLTSVVRRIEPIVTLEAAV